MRQECHNSKFGIFWVIGIERNVCRCTFNRCSVITQFAKLAAWEQFCRRCIRRRVQRFKTFQHFSWKITNFELWHCCHKWAILQPSLEHHSCSGKEVAGRLAVRDSALRPLKLEKCIVNKAQSWVSNCRQMERLVSSLWRDKQSFILKKPFLLRSNLRNQRWKCWNRMYLELWHYTCEVTLWRMELTDRVAGLVLQSTCEGGYLLSRPNVTVGHTLTEPANWNYTVPLLHILATCLSWILATVSYLLLYFLCGFTLPTLTEWKCSVVLLSYCAWT